MNVRRCSILLAGVALSSCQIPAQSQTFEADPSAVLAAVRKVLAKYPSAEEDAGEFETGWENEPLEAGGISEPNARHLRTIYHVRVAGSAVEVSARAEVFMTHGPHARRWERASAAGLERRFLIRVREAIPKSP